MFQIAARETYEDGQVIFEEGSQGKCIYVVQAGEVEISKQARGERQVIGVLKAGEIFGEMASFDRGPRSATVSARGRAVVGRVDHEYFQREYDKLSPDFRNVLRTVSLRIRKINEAAGIH